MSLRTRLVAAVCLVAAVALTFAGVATYTAFRSSQLQEIDDILQRSHEPVEQVIEDGGEDLERAVELAAPGLFVVVIAPTGSTELTIPARSPGHDSLVADIDDLDVPARTAGSPADVPAYSTRRATRGGTEIRVRASRLDDGTILVLGLSLEEFEESRSRLIVIEAIVAAITLLLAGGIGWLLVHIGLRPLRKVEATALRIADGGDLDQEVPGQGPATEIGRLATALNTMLGRIRQAFIERDAKELELQTSEQRMRRFVADVSHELRTPLAAVAAYAELFDRGARDHPEDLERALRGIGLESERMRELVEELLLLAHLDEGRPLTRVRVDLNEIVVDAIGAARAVSADWPVSLRVDEVVVVDGDPSRLRQVVDNLLANVRTHTPAGTATSIALRATDRVGVMTVADNGPGMTAEQAAHVFERFYRADPSRSRASGGAGLGMAIVQAVVDAHHGRIKLDTTPGAGVTITIELPLA